jgi:DNA-binding beta-propeller fold protein YncE
MYARVLLAAMILASCASLDGVPVGLPGGAPGIGFDDLRYSPGLHRVLVPAGRAGTLALVDPESLAIAAIGGFSAGASYDGRHDFGATSVDEGRGLLFVTDRTSQLLSAVDPTAGAIVASASLGSTPDYVRYVAPTDELWVTEPSSSRIEILSAATLRPVTAISVANGPESLVIDASHGRAYTHRWQSTTLVLDVATRAQVAEWPNGCAASRGLAIDAQRGFFFVACLEGTVSVLDVAHDGRVLSTIARGAGYDVIGYSPTLGHLVLAGTACACLVVLGISSSGMLSFLGRYQATGSGHCATADDRGHAWVCDPDGGRLLRMDDPYPASW